MILVNQEYQLKQMRIDKVNKEVILEEMYVNELLLREEINNLHDDEYIADLARSKYQLTRDNEIIFIIPINK